MKLFAAAVAVATEHLANFLELTGMEEEKELGNRLKEAMRPFRFTRQYLGWVKQDEGKGGAS
jgi:hypothetical protein